jgi:hypothetical protein
MKVRVAYPTLEYQSAVQVHDAAVASLEALDETLRDTIESAASITRQHRLNHGTDAIPESHLQNLLKDHAKLRSALSSCTTDQRGLVATKLQVRVDVDGVAKSAKVLFIFFVEFLYCSAGVVGSRCQHAHLAFLPFPPHLYVGDVVSVLWSANIGTAATLPSHAFGPFERQSLGNNWFSGSYFRHITHHHELPFSSPSDNNLRRLWRYTTLWCGGSPQRAIKAGR